MGKLSDMKYKMKLNGRDIFNKFSKSSLSQVWSDLICIFQLAKDWKNGVYTDIPKKSIIMIITGLIYFLLPVDLIGDIIPVIGFVDDVTVLGFVIRQVDKDLEKYKEWKSNSNS